MSKELPFKPASNTKANLRPGALYAIDGGDSYIYYGQIAPDKSLGFFRYRSTTITKGDDVLAREIMSRFGVNYQSIGIALRSGQWLSLGKYPVHDELTKTPKLVQWPMGTLDVTIWQGNKVLCKTKVHDPEIQNFEVIISYDAGNSVPKRLVEDYEPSEESWKVGGSVLRMRIKKEKLAEQSDNQPWHILPESWVHT